MDAFDDVFDNMDNLMDMEALMMAEMLRAEEAQSIFDEPVADAPVIPEVINILNEDVRDAFIEDVLSVGYESEWFTKPAVPTVTLDGTSSGIAFHEEQLMNMLEASPQVIMFTSNFGKVIYPGYTPPTPVKKRKKDVVRRRKVQGDGSSFNSQISCFVARRDYTRPWTDQDGVVHQPEMTPDGLYYVIPTNAPRFEYKIFRNGRLQLPGATLTTFDEGMAGAKLVQLTIWEAIGNKLVQPMVTSMSSVMINFKFIIKLRPRHLVDMKALRDVLELDQYKRGDVRVNLVKYSRQKANLSAEMIVAGYPGVTRTNIYLRGRINIIGVKIPTVATKIFDFLHNIFSTHAALTRREGGVCCVPISHNVRPATDPVAYARMIFENPVHPISADDDRAIAAFIDDVVEEYTREVDLAWQSIGGSTAVW